MASKPSLEDDFVSIFANKKHEIELFFYRFSNLPRHQI